MEQNGPSKNVARALRRRMTETEREVWKHLRRRQTGYYFRRQHRIAGFIVDFYCAEARLCIELDGDGHQIFHSKADRERDEALSALGVLVMRFQNYEVGTDWGGCYLKILAVCKERTSSSESDT